MIGWQASSHPFGSRYVLCFVRQLVKLQWDFAAVASSPIRTPVAS